MEAVVVLLVVAVVLGVIGMLSSIRVVKQYERGVVYRFGRVKPLPRQPGPRLLLPFVDRMTKVNMQVVTMPVPSQEGITRDNVSVRVDAVLYFRVVDPIRATVDVQNYQFAMLQVAQTSLRSIIGKSELDDLLSGREKLHEGLELMLSTPATGWGVHIDRVEIKDVALPESMKRSMARQAEADRERRARIITADGELQASQKLSEAARTMDANPAALQLRMLQTVVEVAAEKNSTLVLPFPVELLRFFDRAGQGPVEQKPTGRPAEGQPAVEQGSADEGSADQAQAVTGRAAADHAITGRPSADQGAVGPAVAPAPPREQEQA